MIVEPLVQGAAGMRMHSDELVRAARAACDRHGVPLIADEVMTGFGRTGALFATLGAGVTPDLLCLAKGLTGGLFPLAATLATEELFEAFLSEDRARAFFHGHTFTAHPIGCAVARASLELCLEDDVPAKLEHIGRRIEAGLALPGVRRRGGIVALDLAQPRRARLPLLTRPAPARGRGRARRAPAPPGQRALRDAPRLHDRRAVRPDRGGDERACGTSSGPPYLTHTEPA